MEVKFDVRFMYARRNTTIRNRKTSVQEIKIKVNKRKTAF